MNRPRPTEPIHFCSDHPDRPAVVTFHGQVPLDAKVRAGEWVNDPCCAECADNSMACLGCGTPMRFTDDAVCRFCSFDNDEGELTLTSRGEAAVRGMRIVPPEEGR